MSQASATSGAQLAPPPPQNLNADESAFATFVAVTLDEFAAVDEPGAEPVVGTADDVLIPAGGDVLVYGDGGAGKTTLTVDLAVHLAAGDDWLGIPVAHPVRVLLVENEGPRPLFRSKLRRKRQGWTGSDLAGRLLVLCDPWGGVSFADEPARRALAATVSDLAVDVLIAGPVTRTGMNEAGTLQEVRDFLALVAHVRKLSGRPLTVILAHHENKGGQVSGAWEGSGDTLLHVSAQGRGRTRVYMQKARWASAYHGTTVHLTWTDGEGFALDDTRREVSDETIAEQILAVLAELPGGSWTRIRDLRDGDGQKRIRGSNTDAAKVRDRLLDERAIVNTAAREGQFTLWKADDPALPRSEPGTGPERLPFPPAERGSEPTRSPVPALKGTGNGTERPTGDHHDAEAAP